jgi:ABC-type lipoprotein release transport system permease subunit
MAIKPEHLKRFHAAMTGVWLLAIVPSVLWWRNSVAWIVFMSVWANLAGHFASWQAARVEVNQEES